MKKHFNYIIDGKQGGNGKTLPKTEEKEKIDPWKRCIKCGNKITTENEKISVQGVFAHTFLNPVGKIFNIGCFQKAVGCLEIGDASTEWSWFENCQWKLVICNSCSEHLGWIFYESEENLFFGLILEKLI